MVLQASAGTETSAEALADLCQTYWPPLYSFLRSRGYAPEDAQDLLQGFFLAFLEKDFVSRARPDAGRFRTFLLTALIRYISKDRAKDRAQKRGGAVPHVRIDADSAESLHQRIPATALSPEQLYERQWALNILERAMDELRARYEKEDKAALFKELSPLLASPDSEKNHRATAERLGMTEGAVRVAAHRLKARYRDIISGIVQETVASPDEIDDEIQYLFEALSRPGPHTP